MADFIAEDRADDEFDELIGEYLKKYSRPVLKAFLIGLMLAFVSTIFSGSILKGLAIGCAMMLISAFNTWRRILEPISLILFLIALAHWCDAELLSHLSWSK